MSVGSFQRPPLPPERQLDSAPHTGLRTHPHYTGLLASWRPFSGKVEGRRRVASPPRIPLPSPRTPCAGTCPLPRSTTRAAAHRCRHLRSPRLPWPDCTLSSHGRQGSELGGRAPGACHRVILSLTPVGYRGGPSRSRFQRRFPARQQPHSRRGTSATRPKSRDTRGPAAHALLAPESFTPSRERSEAPAVCWLSDGLNARALPLSQAAARPPPERRLRRPNASSCSRRTSLTVFSPLGS